MDRRIEPARDRSHEAPAPDRDARTPAVGGAAVARPPVLLPATVLRLQRTAGNHAVQRALAGRAAAEAAAPAAPAGPPAAQGGRFRHTGTGVEFSEDPAFVRAQLEQFVDEHGVDALERFDAADELFVPVGPKLLPDQSADGAQDKEQLARVMRTVREERIRLQAHINAFRRDFEHRAYETLTTVLDESRARIEQERERLGVKTEKTKLLGATVWTSHSGADNPAARALAGGAKALAPKLEPVQRAHQAYQEAALYAPGSEVEAETRRTYEALKADYDAGRAQLEAQHPMVAAYDLDPLGGNTRAHLEKLASDRPDDRADHIGGELESKLANIERVREAAVGDPRYVWKLDRIVGLTSELPDIKGHQQLTHPGVRSDVIATTRSDLEFEAALISIGAAVVMLGLGFIAAAPAAVGAAAAGTAAAADAVATIASAYGAYRSHGLDEAEAGTDYERAKVVSADEPSLFWLAVELLVAARGASRAVQTARGAFKRAAALRESALTAKAVAAEAEARGMGNAAPQYERTLEELEAEGETMRAGAGKRLRRDVESGSGSRRSSTADEGDGPQTARGGENGPPTLANPLPDAAADLGPESKGMTREEAVAGYFKAIQADPDREYAIIQNKETRRFAVLTGGMDRVKTPAHLGPDWAFVRHYHPNLTADGAGRLGPIPRDSKAGVFGTRLPSVGVEKDPGDLIAAKFESMARGQRPVSETLDWHDPSTNAMRKSRFGYNPHAGDRPFWVEITLDDGSVLPARFANPSLARSWLAEVSPAGPPPGMPKGKIVKQ